MRLRSLVAAVVATALTAPTALLLSSAPASAATATKIVGGTDGKKWIYRTSTYASQPGAPVSGDTFSLSINVVTDAGADVYDGTLAVQRKLPGKGWKTFKTSPSAYLYDSFKVRSNASYRVLYSGAGDYSPSSAGVTSKVQRKLEIKNVGPSKQVVLQGKVKPKYKGKAVIYKKNGKKWKKFKTVKVAKKSKFRTPLPAPRKGKYFWNVKIKGSKKFAPTQTGKFSTYSYRQAAQRQLTVR